MRGSLHLEDNDLDVGGSEVSCEYDGEVSCEYDGGAAPDP
jgi:hypothetical protein